MRPLLSVSYGIGKFSLSYTIKSAQETLFPDSAVLYEKRKAGAYGIRRSSNHEEYL